MVEGFQWLSVRSAVHDGVIGVKTALQFVMMAVIMLLLPHETVTNSSPGK